MTPASMKIRCQRAGQTQEEDVGLVDQLPAVVVGLQEQRLAGLARHVGQGVAARQPGGLQADAQGGGEAAHALHHAGCPHLAEEVVGGAQLGGGGVPVSARRMELPQRQA